MAARGSTTKLPQRRRIWHNVAAACRVAALLTSFYDFCFTAEENPVELMGDPLIRIRDRDP